MSTTVAALLAHAANQLGTYERTGNNDVLYADYWGITGSAWCYAFVEWCFDTVGTGARLPYVTMYVPHGVAWSRDNLQSVERDSPPKPGDIVHYTWDMTVWPPDRPGTGDHVGIVESVDGDTITTIEGNIGTPQGVWRLRRSISGTVVNFWRPTVYTDTGEEEDMTPAQAAQFDEMYNWMKDIHKWLADIWYGMLEIRPVIGEVGQRTQAVAARLDSVTKQVDIVAAEAKADRTLVAKQVETIGRVAATVDDIATKATEERQNIIQAVEQIPAGGEINITESIRLATDAQLTAAGAKRLLAALNLLMQNTPGQTGGNKDATDDLLHRVAAAPDDPDGRRSGHPEQ